MKRVVIIGAGIGGLATANLLAAAGYKVSVYEKNAQPGGRAGTLKIDGFTFDTGPSWYLMPEVFEQYFSLFDIEVQRELELIRLDPAYKVFFGDSGMPVTIHADVERDGQTFENIEKGAGKQLRRYLEAAEQSYTTSLRSFLYTNFDKKQALLTSLPVRQLPRLATSLLQPIDRYVGRFFKDHRLKKIMEYPMVFLGTSPFEAPALYSLMSHMDFNQGVYYPKGGLYELIELLVRIGKRLGVSYHYNAPVESIITDHGQARGILLEGSSTQIGADIVISNADLHYTETTLLPEPARSYDPAYWAKKQAGPSALLMYLGIKGNLPEFEHHNLLFTDDWQQNFGDIFKRKKWPHPASLYICKPSQTDKSVAPKGHENLFVLVPAPADPTTTPEQVESLAQTYLEQIETMSGISDLRKRIVVQHLVGPQDFVNNFNSWQGTALGLSHRLNQSALFRPANKSKRVDNLYYVGGNTMPGIGLPMCLISAQLMYKRLASDHSSNALNEIKRLPDA